MHDFSLSSRLVRGGEVSCHFSKIVKKPNFPNIVKKCPDCVMHDVNFSFKMQFLRVFWRKKWEIFTWRVLLAEVLHDCLLECSISKKTLMPWKIPGYAPIHNNISKLVPSAKSFPLHSIKSSVNNNNLFLRFSLFVFVIKKFRTFAFLIFSYSNTLCSRTYYLRHLYQFSSV